MVYIGTKNVRGDEFNPRLKYAVGRHDKFQNNLTRGVIRYRRVKRTIFSDD